MTNIVHLGDCMEGMAGYPDKYFDLAVVDPPYGINASNMTMGSGNHLFKKGKDWDTRIPDKTYFDELFRVSQNQIVWGGNYFTYYLPTRPHWLIWDKKNPNLSFSEAELAWVNIGKNVRIFYHYSAMVEDDGKIHPTQKPVALYDWIFRNYLPNGGKVIDTHIGSGSSRISAYKRGNIDFTGYELDPDYHRDQEARFREFVMKVAPADLEPITKDGQIKLF